MSSHSFDQFDRAWDIVENVRGLPTSEQDAAVSKACGNDTDLLRIVNTLLSSRTSAVLLTGGAQAMAGEAVADSARELLDDLGPGDEVGTYRLIRELGVGGMSRVYLAMREGVDFEQQVAVKLMRAFSSTGAESRARFEREQQVLANLSHPNIASIIDGGVTPSGRPFLVMEYVDGRPVSDFCREQSLTLEERLDVFQNICAAVEHAHRALVVHRDLKPSNVLVNADGQVKLLDFGIAKLLDEAGTSSLTQTGLMMLTPQYAAPEQVTNSPITTATDVYALGLLLFELLTDKKAWDAEQLSVSEQLASICEKPFPKPSAVSVLPWSGRLKGDLDLVVAKALAKVPAERYPSCSEFVSDVRAWRADRPVTAHAPRLGYRMAKFTRRNWLGVATVAVFASVVAVFIAALLQQQSATLQERDRARTAQEATSAVNRFLIDELLGATATDEGVGRDVPVSVLLARAEETVGRAFGDQPGLEVSIRETLSRTFLRLGDTDRAERNVIAARERLAASSSELSRDRVDAHLDRLGLIDIELQLASGDEMAARKAAESILRTLSDKYGANSVNAILARMVLARAQIQLDEWPLAQAHLSDVLEVIETRYPDRWRLLTEAQFDLTRVLYEQRKTDEALIVLDARLEVQTRYLGEHHPDILTTLRWKSLVLSRLQRREEAATVAQSVYELSRRVFGDGHLETAVAAGGLARLWVRNRRYDEAVTLFRIEVAALEQEHGFVHVDTLSARQNLGVALSYAGRSEEAEAVKREALDGLTTLYGERHTRTLRAHRNLASTLSVSDKPRMHRETVEELVRIYSSFDGDRQADPIQLSDAADWLLNCEPAELRDPEKALAMVQQAVELSRREDGTVLLTLADALAATGQSEQAIDVYEEAATHRSVVHIHSLLRNAAKLYLKTNQIERAEAFFHAHHRRREAARAEDDWLHGMTWHELARLYIHAGMAEQAEPVVRRAIAHYRKSREPDDPLVFRSKAVLGAALTQLGRYSQGEEHLLAAYHALVSDLQVTSDVKREIITWLVEHYSLREQSRDFEYWQAESVRRQQEPLFSDWSK